VDPGVQPRCPFRVSRDEPGLPLPLRARAAFREFGLVCRAASSLLVLTEVRTRCLPTSKHDASRLAFLAACSEAPCLITGDQSRALMTHALSIKDTFRFARSFPVMLAEAINLGRDSSLGVHQRLPLHRCKHCASTPRLPESRPSARRCQSPRMFRPCRSTRLRRFPPRRPCGSIAPRYRP
jgi:hypothetical protein